MVSHHGKDKLSGFIVSRSYFVRLEMNEGEKNMFVLDANLAQAALRYPALEIQNREFLKRLSM